MVDKVWQTPLAPQGYVASHASSLLAPLAGLPARAGPDHKINVVEGGKDLFMSMVDYAKSAVELYLQVHGARPLRKVETHSTTKVFSQLRIGNHAVRWEIRPCSFL